MDRPGMRSALHNRYQERRRGRELVLQSLYAADSTGVEGLATLTGLPGWERASEEARDFARMLVERIVQHRQEIDAVLANVVKHWDLSRVARVDHSIIRLAACELLFCPDIPTAVAIDEGIELAKKYSTEQSGRFVNGVLDAIAGHALAGSDVPPGEPAAELAVPQTAVPER